jgi:hypothetical protein
MQKNYSRNLRREIKENGGGVNSSMIYLIYGKNLSPLTQHNNKGKKFKNKMILSKQHLKIRLI